MTAGVDRGTVLLTGAAGPSCPSDGFVGGGYTSPGFGIDEVAARS